MIMAHSPITLECRSEEEQIKILKRTYPNITRDLICDCVQVLAHYEEVINGCFWMKVSPSAEDYFQTYHNRPRSWFENVRKFVLEESDRYARSGQHGRTGGMTIEHPPLKLSCQKEKTQLRFLTSDHPEYTKSFVNVCKQVIAHYDIVVNGELWKKVSATEEDYFLTYYNNRPKAWFENVRKFVLEEETDHTVA